MGYRSDAALALVTDAAILLKALCEHDESLNQFIEDACDKCAWEKSEIAAGYTTKFFWSSIKWYEGYDDIDMIEAFINNIPESDFYFLRIGEEENDNEIRGEFWESDMYINRNISY